MVFSRILAWVSSDLLATLTPSQRLALQQRLHETGAEVSASDDAVTVSGQWWSICQAYTILQSINVTMHVSDKSTNDPSAVGAYQSQNTATNDDALNGNFMQSDAFLDMHLKMAGTKGPIGGSTAVGNASQNYQNTTSSTHCEATSKKPGSGSLSDAEDNGNAVSVAVNQLSDQVLSQSWPIGQDTLPNSLGNLGKNGDVPGSVTTGNSAEALVSSLMGLESGSVPGRYRCVHCGKSFTRKDYMAVHSRRHTGKTFNCNICKASFVTKCNLQQHFDTQHLGIRYRCEICDKYYATLGGLTLHKREHEGKFVHCCPTCGRGFNYKTSFETHVAKHVGVRAFKCTQCLRRFHTKALLTQHKACCGAKKTLQCEKCPKKFKVDRILKEHMKTHEENKTQYQCSTCGKMFNHRASLSNHQTKHHGNSNTSSNPSLPPNKSPESPMENPAGSTETNASEVNTGNNNEKAEEGNILTGKGVTTATAVPELQCKYCGKLFSRKDNLATHTRRHTGNTFNCNMCDRSFVTRRARHEHFTTHHLGQRFKCSMCDGEFATKGGLQLHQREHLGIYTHTCPICGKGFNYKTAFDTHVAKHTGARAFECLLCGKCFTNRSGLSQHKSVCGTEATIACDRCPRFFKTAMYLKQHIKLHENPNRHECLKCGEVFAHTVGLNRHDKLKHKLDHNDKDSKESN